MKLQYETPVAHEPPNPRLLKASLWCGLIPLIGGFGILFTYWLSRDEILTALGLLWLAVGGITVGVGGISLMAYFAQFVRSTDRSARTIAKIVVIALLLFSNLPAAWFCMEMGIKLLPPMSG